MIQQQIVDYAKSQLKLGISQDAVKNALVRAGWAEADVEDSFGSMEIGGSRGSAPEEKAKKPEGAPIIVSDLIANSQLEVMPLVGDKELASAKSVKPKKFLPTPKFHLNKATTVIIVLGVLVAGLAAIAAILYFQNKDLAVLEELEEGAASSGAQVAELQVQIAGLNEQISLLQSELQSETESIKTELSLFVALPDSPGSKEITLKGTLHGGEGGDAGYTLETQLGSVVIIVNSADEGVENVLRPLVGNEVEITGSHAPGSAMVEITKVNGSDIPEPAAEEEG